ncbi:MAG: cupin domain-containing protein [Nitrospirae bacterium]|nr:cupin domain-containing protein [Nitrospirota bacterium]
METGKRPDDPEAPEVLRAIEDHGLRPHPEGGYYREVHRSEETVRPADGTGPVRGAVSVILFLIPGHVETRWHRVSSCEIWHHAGGAPLLLSFGREAPPETRELDREAGNCLAIVPAGAWQRARSLGVFSLATCTVAPAFDFQDFSLWDAPGSPFEESTGGT